MNKTKVRISAMLIIAASFGMVLSNGVVLDNIAASLQGMRTSFHSASYSAPVATTSERPDAPHINENVRVFGNLMNEADLVSNYGTDIIVEGVISDRDMFHLLVAAQKFNKNPLLSSLLPVHEQTMTTAKNFAAFLSPDFPGVYRRGIENVDSYLSGYQISKMLAGVFLNTNGNHLEKMLELELINSAETSIWGNQNPDGVLLRDAVGLYLRFLDLSEASSVEDLAAYTRNTAVQLNEGKLRFNQAAVAAMLKAFAIEKGDDLPSERTIEKYYRDMRGYKDMVVTSSLVRELRDRYNRANAPAVYVPYQSAHLGDCGNRLLEKLTLASYFETGELGLNVSCDLDIRGTEKGELTVTIPPMTSVMNVYGMPDVSQVIARGAIKDKSAFEVQFPQNNANALFIGANGETTVTVRYQSQKRKPKTGMMGVIITDRNNTPLQTLTAGYDDRFRAEVQVNPRHLMDDQFTVIVDPLLQ